MRSVVALATTRSGADLEERARRTKEGFREEVRRVVEEFRRRGGSEKDQYEGAKVYIRSLRKKGLTQAFCELVQDPEEGSSDTSSSSGESPVLGARARSPVRKEFL